MEDVVAHIARGSSQYARVETFLLILYGPRKQASW